MEEGRMENERRNERNEEAEERRCTHKEKEGGE
jgi:hypothetical protein